MKTQGWGAARGLAAVSVILSGLAVPVSAVPMAAVRLYDYSASVVSVYDNSGVDASSGDGHISWSGSVGPAWNSSFDFFAPSLSGPATISVSGNSSSGGSLLVQFSSVYSGSLSEVSLAGLFSPVLGSLGSSASAQLYYGSGFFDTAHLLADYSSGSAQSFASTLPALDHYALTLNVVLGSMEPTQTADFNRSALNVTLNDATRVPEGGSTLALLGVGVLGMLGFRYWSRIRSSLPIAKSAGPAI